MEQTAMGRPAGSKNKSHDGNGEAPVLRNTCDGAELHSYIERVEEINKTIKEYSDDRREIFREFKAKGYDQKTLQTIIRRRAMDADKRDAADALLEMYSAALGDFASTPLGTAGADRLRDVASAE